MGREMHESGQTARLLLADELNAELDNIERLVGLADAGVAELDNDDDWEDDDWGEDDDDWEDDWDEDWEDDWDEV